MAKMDPRSERPEELLAKTDPRSVRPKAPLAQNGPTETVAGAPLPEAQLVLVDNEVNRNTQNNLVNMSLLDPIDPNLVQSQPSKNLQDPEDRRRSPRISSTSHAKT